MNTRLTAAKAIMMDMPVERDFFMTASFDSTTLKYQNSRAQPGFLPLRRTVYRFRTEAKQSLIFAWIRWAWASACLRRPPESTFVRVSESAWELAIRPDQLNSPALPAGSLESGG